MTGRMSLVLWLAVVGFTGCGSNEGIMLDPSKLQPETESQAQASKAYDEKINEEEGQSFGKKAGPTGAGRRKVATWIQATKPDLVDDRVRLKFLDKSDLIDEGDPRRRIR